MSDVVGKTDRLNVIKDFGLKEPYNGLAQIVNGNIDEDFAYYFTASEQLPSAVALGVKMQDGNCVKAGGIVVQPMPNCSEEEIFYFAGYSLKFYRRCFALCEKALRRLWIFISLTSRFLICLIFYEEYKCSCSRNRIERCCSLWAKEALEIVETQGEIQVGCEFCNSKYVLQKTTCKGCSNDKISYYDK